jgi:hypothetical protein
MMIVPVLVLAWLTIPLPAGAPPQGASNPLARVKTLSCSFPVYATADWSGVPPGISSKTQELTFEITSIDLNRRRARIVGSGGSADVTAVLTGTGLNIIEQTPIGNFILTTVFTAGGTGGAYLAVHSRHIGDLKFPPGVSQSYGTCR